MTIYVKAGNSNHGTVNTCSSIRELSRLMMTQTAVSKYINGTVSMQRDFPAPAAIWTNVAFPCRAGPANWTENL